MTEDDILFRLQEWLLDQIGEELDISINYLESGDLDSFHVISFVSFIETTFDIRLQLEDLQSQDFNTLEGLARLIKTLISQKAK